MKPALRFLFIATAAVFFGCATASAEKPMNVILFIGDGMGPAQVDATVYTYLGQTIDEDGNPARLSFEHFPVTGTITTFAGDSLVTDSAASATSMSAGIKTYNGAIGVDNDRQPVTTITELAKKHGMSTGVVSSVGINHATPASFYAKNESRKNYNDIFQSLVAADFVDVALGGGVFGDMFALSKAQETADETKIAFYTTENLDQLDPQNAGDRRVIGLFDSDGDHKLKYMFDRQREETDEPELKDLTLKALELLEPREGGFFVMIEGGSIDWAGHANEIDLLMGEVLALSDAVQTAVDYLDEKGELDKTLILVTADHETGGLTIVGPYKKVGVGREEMEFNFSSNQHTAVAVRVHAHGPGSELAQGRQDQTNIFRTMKTALDF